MNNSEKYGLYNKQYNRVANALPRWNEALADPKRFACNAPWLPKNKEAKILDFGCGWGHQLMALWCAGYQNLEGVEISKDQAAICHFEASGRLPVVNIDGRDFLKNIKDTYDLIILNDVLEHLTVAEAKQTLSIIHQSLQPHGTIVIRTPNMSSLLSSYSLYIDITHISGYTEYSIQQILDQSGFENHCFVTNQWCFSLRSWRPWAPWRGFCLKLLINTLVHKILYQLRGQIPSPSIFDFNLTVYSQKPGIGSGKNNPD
jgi:2-polyprenyl-3-methyl-5-hydroxy-6-metoxy-1,4-benzoquinol methylase